MPLPFAHDFASLYPYWTVEFLLSWPGRTISSPSTKENEFIELVTNDTQIVRKVDAARRTIFAMMIVQHRRNGSVVDCSPALYANELHIERQPPR
jgi:hypothetical protein